MKTSTLLAVGLTGVLALGAGYWFSQQPGEQSTAPVPPVPVATSPAAATPGARAHSAGDDTLIDFELPDSAGQPRKLSDWSGKVMVLNFWATWCPPCREEIPIFLDLYEKYRAQGLIIVGVAIDRREDVLTFMDTLLIDYPILIGGEDMMNMMVRYGNNIGALPYSVIIDRQGKIVQRQRGDYKKADLIRHLEPLLKPQS